MSDVILNETFTYSTATELMSVLHIDKSKQTSEDSLPSSVGSEESLPTNNPDMGRNRGRRKSKNKIHKPNDKKKMHRQAQNKIEKLKKVFDELRNQSSVSLDSTHDNTVIVLDDTIETPNNNKRKRSDSNITEPNKCMRIVEDPLVIPNDDVLVVNNGQCNPKTPRKYFNLTPKDCSTPISKSATSIPENNNTNEVENFNSDVNNLTKEINRDSYLTIDLTTESNANTTLLNNSVIDLDNVPEPQDCTFVSMSNTSLSISGESDVTVIQNLRSKKMTGKSMNSFVRGIAKMNSSEKGKLLEMITQNIFSGCKVPKKIRSGLSMVKEHINQGTETVEDTYIKEVILGEKQSRNSIGSNIYNPEKVPQRSGLRMIVIDGSNVAMEHGKGVFSVKGLNICIDHFLKRGHVVKAFVPRFRCKWGKSTEPRQLDALERRGLVIYTPSREIRGRFITSYDDRYIVQCAAEFDGVIVSGDNYRDLVNENPRWRSVIENRVLPFTWVNDMIMFPKDPLGRYGPSLETFLKHPVEAQPGKQL